MPCLLALAMLALATPLWAQSGEDAGRRRASFTAGASLGDGDAALALAAALGFQVTARLGIEFEAAHARRLAFTIDLCPPPRVCVIGGQLPVTGRTVSLVPQLTLELLPSSRRVRAYVQGGAGAGHVRQRYWFPRRGPGAVEFTRSNLVVALSYGGGAAARISRRLELGADVRWLHLRDDPPDPGRFITPAGTLTTARVGARASWRF